MTALPETRSWTAPLAGVVIGGVVVAVAAPLLWGASAAGEGRSGGRPSSVGVPLVRPPEPSAGSPSATRTPSTRPAAPAPGAAALPVLRVSDTAPAVVTGAAAPVLVRLPGLGVDAPVDPVGATPEGAVTVPDDGARTGWWSAGAAPGDGRGSTVIVGHVDTPAGPGALFRLGSAEPGQDVLVLDAAGVERTYRVSTRAQVLKSELPVAELFTTAGPPRLVIISCGGAFDRRTRHYQDNVVVIAELVR